MINPKANRTPTIVATVVVLWVLSLIAVGARFLARHIGRTKRWWDDWLILTAATIFVPAATVDLLEAHLGAGKHSEIVFQEHPGNAVKFLKAIYAGEIFYPPIIACIKCSILALYYRLFGVRKGFALTCYVLISVTVAWSIALLLPSIFQCNPIYTAWDPTSTRSNCVQLRAFLVGTNVPNILLDISILTAPLYPIWKLKLPTTKKIWISGILLLGALDTAVSIIRLVALTSLDVSDTTWNYLPPIVWSTVEISVGMICACLPVMAPLVRAFGRFFSSNASKGSSSLGLSNIPRVTTGHATQNFNRLGDDSTELVVRRDDPGGITRTTDIIVNEDDIPLQSRV